MKKLVLSILATVGIMIAMPAAALAAPANSVVAGIVRGPTGNVVAGADVTVTCNGKTKTDTTDSKGNYGVQFAAKDCPKDTKVTVAASKGAMNGANSGPIVEHTDINVVVLDVKIAPVPELGLITATGAGIVGATSFMMLRRRTLPKQM